MASAPIITIIKPRGNNVLKNTPPMVSICVQPCENFRIAPRLKIKRTNLIDIYFVHTNTKSAFAMVCSHTRKPPLVLHKGKFSV